MACDATSWRRRTSNNIHSRRVIFVDPWKGTGLGHVLLGHASIVALALRLNRSLRFATCAPRALAASFSPPMPACEAGGTFDVLDYVEFAGVPDLQAQASDWQRLHLAAVVRGQQYFHRKPSCAQLQMALTSDAPMVWIHLATVVTVKCAASTLEGAELGTVACARRIRARRTPGIVRPRRLACTVGLHLRSLALDDAGCDLLADSPSALCLLPEAATRRAQTRRSRSRHCAPFGFPQSITPAPRHDTRAVCRQGERLFATADDPALYTRHTRQLGWRDLGEEATRTWVQRAKRNASTHEQAATVATVAAWLALTRCKHAIVAPVPSKFSDSAALVGGVPVLRCCQEPLRWAAR